MKIISSLFNILILILFISSIAILILIKGYDININYYISIIKADELVNISIGIIAVSLIVIINQSLYIKKFIKLFYNIFIVLSFIFTTILLILIKYYHFNINHYINMITNYLHLGKVHTNDAIFYILVICIISFLVILNKFLSKRKKNYKLVKTRKHISNVQIYNYQSEISQRDLTCEELAKKIKFREWRSSLILFIILAPFLLFLLDDIPQFSVLSILVLLVLFGTFGSLLNVVIIPFRDYKALIQNGEQEKILLDVIKTLAPQNIDLDKIIALGRLKIYQYDNITDKIKIIIPGYAFLELHMSEDKNQTKYKLVLLDSQSCKIAVIKDFNLSNLKKFTIIDDIHKIDKVNQASEQLKLSELKAAINPNQQRGVNRSLIELGEALDEVKLLYVVFDDKTELIISDLTKDAFYLYEYIAQ